MLGTFHSLGFDQITVPDVKLREADLNSPKYQQLMVAIDQMGGIHTPIKVRELPDGKYELIDGVQRLTILQSLNEVSPGRFETIPAFQPKSDISDLEMQGLMISSNFSNVETRPAQASRLLHEMRRSDPTLGVPGLAKLVGMSTSWVSDRLNLRKLNDSLVPIVDSGEISVTSAIALAKLPATEQESYRDAAMRDDTSTFLNKVDARLREIQEAANTGKKAEAPKFVPISKLRSKDVIIAEITARVVASQLAPGAEDAFAAALKWAVSLDPASIEAARAEWQNDQDARAAREADRIAKAKAKAEAKEAAKAATEAGNAATVNPE